MKKIFYRGLCLLGLISLFFAIPANVQGATLTPGNQPSSKLSEGSSAPPINLIDAEGNKVDWSNYRGKYVYINFWATWCDPCLKEMPDLEALYQKYKDNEDFVFLSVTAPKDERFNNPRASDESAEHILQVAEEEKLSYPVLFDNGGDTMRNYQVQVFPSHVLINKEGKIEKSVIGALPISVLENEIEKMLQEGKSERTST